MKNQTLAGCCMAALIALPLASCGKKKDASSQFPSNFNTIGDAGRVDYLIKHTTPDSVARFIIHTALGHNPGVKIDTLAIATSYAYESLRDDALDSFSIAYDGLVESLPLADKMKIYKLAGSEDPQGLGYKLGLEYMATIRNDNKKVADVRKELREFEKACANDTDTYRRFMIGFKTVLKVDHGNDVPEEIYREFAE